MVSSMLFGSLLDWYPAASLDWYPSSSDLVFRLTFFGPWSRMWVFMCLFSLPFSLNLLEHTLQGKGRSLVCVLQVYVQNQNKNC